MFASLVVLALFEGEKPGTIIMVLAIVAFLVGTGITVVTLGIVAEARNRQRLKESNEPTANPDPASPIQRYRGTGGLAPREVALLGEPERIHKPSRLTDWLSKNAVRPKYQSYPDALVMLWQEQYTVIPWQAITEYLHGTGFRVCTGEIFYVDSDVTDFGYLYEKLQRGILERVLPAALGTMRAGGIAVFTPFESFDSGWRKAWGWLDGWLLGPFTISAKA